MSYLEESYTINELIGELKALASVYGEDRLVVASSYYGDSAREQLNGISEVTADLPIRTTHSYFGYAFGDNIDSNDDTTNEDIVIVLRGV